MMNDELFSEIRPYRDRELPEVMKHLLSTPQIDTALQAMYPTEAIPEVKNKIRQIPTIKQFQKVIIYDVLSRMLKATSTSFTSSGIEAVKGGEPYLYISNHRDIVLDPSLISYVLVENDMDIPEVAIGDNLIKEEWIRHLVRVNGSFIVKRNLPPRELVQASRLLSQYIYYSITSQNQSVWIAQKEGRAKDGNDVTQSGLLGMLAMYAKDGMVNHYIELNPATVSISYEFDPTDVEKVRRLYAERFLGGYKKELNEDENSMRNGIMGHKGGIHIHFGKPLKDKLKNIPEGTRKAEIETYIRNLLDYQIIKGYKLWPVNHIAEDLFLGNRSEFSRYNKEQRDEFVEVVENKVDAMTGDKGELKKIFYEIYGRPAINAKTVKLPAELAPADKIIAEQDRKLR